MAYEKREGNGAVFKNEHKESENHADYKGDILIGGQEYWLNCFIKKSKGGKSYMSISAKLKDPNKNVAAALKQVREQPKGGHAPSSVDDFNDDCPF